MLKIDEKVSNCLGPCVPTRPLIDLQGVNKNINYLPLVGIDQERNLEFLRVLYILSL